jgi:small subunit ribosomal protein S16
MVRIRLRRVGSKNQPSFRIVAADKESPRDGRFLENLGHYNPRTEPATIEVDETRLFHWLRHGAQPSDSVLQILKPLGTWDRWERFKAGEELEMLLEEAKVNAYQVDPRTRRDDLILERRTKKVQKKASPPAEKAAPAKAETADEESAPDEAPEEEIAPEEAVAEVAEQEAAVEGEEKEEPEKPVDETKDKIPEEATEETAEEIPVDAEAEISEEGEEEKED